MCTCGEQEEHRRKGESEKKTRLGIIIPPLPILPPPPPVPPSPPLPRPSSHLQLCHRQR